MCRSTRLKRRARNEANNSPLMYQLGAVIFKGGKMLSSGFNYGSIHAEHSAIRRAKMDIRGADIFVVRVNKTGFAMAKPCPNCQLLLKENGIKRAFYSNSNGEIEMIKVI